jgi:hypothetical protein
VTKEIRHRRANIFSQKKLWTLLAKAVFIVLYVIVSSQEPSGGYRSAPFFRHESYLARTLGIFFAVTTT